MKIRLKERKIPQNYPSKILAKPDEQFVDTVTNYKIAVKSLSYNLKIRPMLVVYDIIESEILVITIHPISNQEINNKREKGRWKIYEKN